MPLDFCFGHSVLTLAKGSKRKCIRKSTEKITALMNQMINEQTNELTNEQRSEEKHEYRLNDQRISEGDLDT
ncbi:MAG: hypothetical protein EZS28_000183 [Streblomastix strix]|uniref:Uncharacterized protein n=1 Tax=Streblomastix strix TaxID=222440 RepID=A0A5J4XAS1_9EUKA|nr:MAG: hypothetical protein EZS28_000183 [Streblomastix strix]